MCLKKKAVLGSLIATSLMSSGAALSQSNIGFRTHSMHIEKPLRQEPQSSSQAFHTLESKPVDAKTNQKIGPDTATRPQISGVTKTDKRSEMAQKRERAMMLVDSALASSRQISPIEYGVLTEVEAATLLWRVNRERAHSILKGAVSTIRRIMDDQESNADSGNATKSINRLTFIVIRKVAALDPSLVTSLFSNDSSKPGGGAKSTWTPQARAVMSVASELTENDPKAAARLAEQSLSLGFTDWENFLERLGAHNAVEAERLARLLIAQLRDSSITPIAFQDLSSFIFDTSRSSTVQDYFFQSILIRLQRDIHPDASLQDLQDDLIIGRNMSLQAATWSPQWQSRFDNVIPEIEALFRTKSGAPPGVPTKRMLDVSMLGSPSPGDTQTIKDAFGKAGTIKNAEVRDLEYKRLAAKAALSEDLSLANEIAMKIDDEGIRRETTLLVYGPFVRKSISESDWARAQTHALNISEPLGRTLVFDNIAQAMARSGQAKSSVKEVYTLAASRLERDWSTEEVAKAFLILAKSLVKLDQQASIDAIRSAIAALNRLSLKAESFGRSIGATAITTWVRLPNYSLRASEVLDTIELLEAVFTETARQDLDTALVLTDAFQHSGLHALARLAVARTLLQQADIPQRQTEQRLVK